MRAAIYTRVSTEEQAEEGVSLAGQEALCRERAAADGATDVELVTDPGYSGKSLDRPGIQRLLQLLPAVSHVYVYDMSRLSRDLLDQLVIERRMIAAGVTLISLSDPVDHSTASGRMVGHVTSAVAQYQREQTAERTRMAIRQRASEGKYVGWPPFGYEWERNAWGESTGRIVVVPEDARIMRELFERYDAGASLRELAQWLQAEGVRGARGACPWRPDNVGKLLRHHAYVGQVKCGDLIAKGLHEPIISAALWQRVQQRLDRRRNIHPRSRDASLAPILRCGVCGGTIGVSVAGPKGRRYRRYQCVARTRVPCEQRHAGTSAPADALERVVWEYVHELLDGERLQRALDRYLEQRREAQAEDSRASAVERLAYIDLEIERNLAAYHAGACPLDVLVKRNEPLMAERERLRQRTAEGAAENNGFTHAEMARLREHAAGAVQHLQASGRYDRQLEILGRLFTRIDLRGPDIVVCHRLDLPPKRIDVPRRQPSVRHP